MKRMKFIGSCVFSCLLLVLTLPSAGIADECATYDSLSGRLYLRCVNLGGASYWAQLGVTPSTTLQLEDFGASASQGTEAGCATFDAESGTANVPCVLFMGGVYSADFGMVSSDPFTFSLLSSAPASVPDAAPEEVFMPGSQPNEAGAIDIVGNCAACHGRYGSGEAPYDSWRGTMMANSARDPLFWALLAVENREFESSGVAIGDFCLRCHVPKGWIEGRSEPADGSAFTGFDLDGVQCDVCHRMVDPQSAEGSSLVSPDVQGYRNGQYVISPEVMTKRGPHSDAVSPSHSTLKSDFHLTSEFCGTCHDISNPFYSNAVAVEKTYSEWKYSAYPPEGVQCRDCHMPSVSGFGALPALQPPLRPDIAVHRFIGGNAWAPLAIKEFDTSLSAEDRAFLDQTRNLAIEQLRSAAQLEATSAGGTLQVRVTNLTGHKLPTGYTEGRRMWIQVTFYDLYNAVISESGSYDEATGVLTMDPDIKIYEANPGLQGVAGYADGPSFHFALNNVIYKDNRIPPRGFTNAGYEAAGAPVVGASYADGQNYDITMYPIPAGAVRATVSLLYQTTTKEFIEFLRDQNIGNAKYDIKNAGQMIYSIWENTGKAAPVVMASEEVIL